MEVKVAPEAPTHRTGSVRRPVEAAYVLAVTGMAAYGMAAESHRPAMVLAALVALPLGIAAPVGLYGLTGVFNILAANGSSSSWSYQTGGCNPLGHCWSRTVGTPVGAQGWLFCTCVVLLFTAAAFGNVLLLRSLGRRRPQPGPA